MNALTTAAGESSIASRDLVDALTGIRNRRGFVDGVNALVAVCRETDEPLALIEIEIVDFHEAVRSHGHRHGESLLRMTAGLIGNASRAGDLTGRTGVSAFALLLPGVTQTLAEQVGERLRSAAEALSGHSRSGPLSLQPLALRTTVRSLETDRPFL
jgi:diguanylate cyclase (GGDEF)-like protein